MVCSGRYNETIAWDFVKGEKLSVKEALSQLIRVAKNFGRQLKECDQCTKHVHHRLRQEEEGGACQQQPLERLQHPQQPPDVIQIDD